MGAQKEEENIVTLLDDESRAVLGLLHRGAAAASASAPHHPAPLSRTKFASDLTNRPAKVRLVFSSNDLHNQSLPVVLADARTWNVQMC